MTRTRAIRFTLFCCSIVALCSCGANMSRNGRLKPYEANATFPDGQSARPIPADTVARGQSTDIGFVSGAANGQPITQLPLPVTVALIARGQNRYQTFCTPCHGDNAIGDGPVSGYFNPRPPALLGPGVARLPNGKMFQVITNGYRSMYGYGDRIGTADRWAIIAYIRALQISPDAPLQVSPQQVQQAGGS